MGMNYVRKLSCSLKFQIPNSERINFGYCSLAKAPHAHSYLRDGNREFLPDCESYIPGLRFAGECHKPETKLEAYDTRITNTANSKADMLPYNCAMEAR